MDQIQLSRRPETTLAVGRNKDDTTWMDSSDAMPGPFVRISH